METRRMLNSALPRGLFWAQFGLYVWAVFPLLRDAIDGHFSLWTAVFAFFRAAAAYGISNEQRFGYWLGLIVCSITIIPTLNELVHRVSLLLQPDFVILLVVPVAVAFGLLSPSSREYERIWFR